MKEADKDYNTAANPATSIGTPNLNKRAVHYTNSMTTGKPGMNNTFKW